MSSISTIRTQKMASQAKSIMFQLLCLAVGISIMFPVIYAFLISFMDAKQVLTRDASIIPEHWTLDNYKTALKSAPLMRFMLNSLIISACSGLIRVIVSSLAAYAFAFFEFRGKKLLFLLVMGTFMIPGDVVLAANYQTVARMHLINTYVGMMVIFLVSGMNIFMMRQSFLTFSSSIRDAADIDGCSHFTFFWKILLPMNISTLITVFITSFMTTWNTYLWPMMVTNKTELRTIQVGITMLNFTEGTVHGPIMAAAIIVMVPTLCLFFLFQKQIVSGMMAGGVKE